MNECIICNGVADPLKYAPPPYVEFGRSASKDVGTNKGEPKKWEVLGPAL